MSLCASKILFNSIQVYYSYCKILKVFFPDKSVICDKIRLESEESVSYTHLTLPTIYSV